MSTAIKVENLSKIYRLGEIGTGTISRDLERWIRMKMMKQEDPFLKIGQTNDRTKKGENDIVYSLRDINFKVEQGDAVGIIGRNGAGKSTLLKILSRVTSPTTGKIHVKGRVASLLEVGTGFHPELTGKDNIYLNGAILGMRKKEIDRKIDEIIEFSGVKRYIDTPVKRYSSGMYVRLAFAVAAHLESEILIVDEVLAVGDAEFQKKCLGKMGEVTKGEGRTVLFVSHNMTAIKTLCNSGILLSNGIIAFNGNSIACIDKYGSQNDVLISYKSYDDINSRPSTENIEFLSYFLRNINGEIISSFNIYDEVFLELNYLLKNEKFEIYPNIHFFDKEDNYLMVTSSTRDNLVKKYGFHKTIFTIPSYLFNVGILKIGIAFTLYPGTDVQFYINPALIVEVTENDLSRRHHPYTGPMPGRTRINLKVSNVINYK